MNFLEIFFTTLKSKYFIKFYSLSLSLCLTKNYYLKNENNTYIFIRNDSHKTELLLIPIIQLINCKHVQIPNNITLLHYYINEPLY